MDNVSKARRSEIMRAVRSKRTTPEMLLHGILKGERCLHGMWPEIDGHPDVIIYGNQCEGRPDILVFVDGCFWHKCPKHYRRPRTNRAFWDRKIAANVRRDRRVRARLRALGYRVVRIWEHQLVGRRG